MNRIELLKNNLLNSREGITQEEYKEIIRHYYNIDTEKLELKYDRYKYAEVFEGNNKISFINMDKTELYIYDKIIRSIFIKG